MAILRNHSCGHNQRICPRCLSTGCNSTRCPESIGNGTSMICKNCGCNNVMSMETYQVQKKSKAQQTAKTARDTQIRMANLEKATNTRYVGDVGQNKVYSGGSADHYYSGGGFGGLLEMFRIKYIIFALVCFGLSTVLTYSDYTGVIRILVAIINLVGGLVALVIWLISWLFGLMF